MRRIPEACLPVSRSRGRRFRASIGALALAHFLALAVGELVGASCPFFLIVGVALGWVASSMIRWLEERNKARDSSDLFTRSLLDHLTGEAPDFGKAMVGYFNADGPAWVLPPGEFMITRYDWTKDMTAPVAVFADKGAAAAELERLRAIEVEERARGKITRNQHYTIVRRGRSSRRSKAATTSTSSPRSLR
jgi:hypothetical protein